MRRLIRFVTTHPISVTAFFIMVYLAFLFLWGCTASTRIDPAQNVSKVETETVPTTESVRVRVGGQEVKP